MTRTSFIALTLFVGLIASPTSFAQSTEAGTKTNLPATSFVTSSEAQSFYEEGIRLFKASQEEQRQGNQKGSKRLAKQSLKAYKKALQLEPDFPEATSNIAYLYLADQQFKKAAQWFDKAIELKPTHLNSLNGLATVYTLQNKHDQAAPLYKQLITLAPANAVYRFNQGSSFHKAGDLKAAKQAYLKAIDLDKKLLQAHFNLGALYEQEGQVELAIQSYRNVKRLGLDTPIGLEALNRLDRLR